jgi:hypothetical protein
LFAAPEEIKAFSCNGFVSLLVRGVNTKEMKTLFRLAVPLFTFLLFSCNKSESVNTHEAVAGTWKLVETLADPGDGSGAWQPVTGTSQTYLLFYDNGMIGGNAFPEARNYAVVNGTTIKFTYADGTFINYSYTLSESTLVLSGGGCIEACGAKFVRETATHN